MQFALHRILSVNAGFLDAADYLALNGHFTAHLTENFVALSAPRRLGFANGGLGATRSRGHGRGRCTGYPFAVPTTASAQRCGADRRSPMGERFAIEHRSLARATAPGT